jgi:hypothetical protein
VSVVLEMDSPRNEGLMVRGRPCVSGKMKATRVVDEQFFNLLVRAFEYGLDIAADGRVKPGRPAVTSVMTSRSLITLTGQLHCVIHLTNKA